MIPASFVRDLRDRVDIVEVVAAHVQLRPSGRSFVGLCPFHQEKSPSFHVSRERQMYHCFGCQRGGDVVRFLMEVEGLSFTEAVRDLAARVGIEVPAEFVRGPRADGDADARRERWWAVLAAAQTFFQRMLWDDAVGAPARRYLAERGVAREVADRFGLGFAPQAWDRLLGALQAARHSPADLETMGLVVPRQGGGGYYDRFRGRLIFPVHDVRGRPIAFSGRVLPGLEDTGREGGAETAKYINSPETPLYRKGRCFLGLTQARQAIRAERSVILVEGNFDLLAVHALGHPNVLAPLGTALTPEQATLLRRLGAESVTLLFDPDEAGMKAARRGFPVLAAAGLAVRWARLPAGRDPGSLLPQAEHALLDECLAGAPSFLERAVREAAVTAGEAPEARAAAARELAVFIAALPDVAERDAQVFRAAAALGLERHVVHRAVEAAARGAAAGGGPGRAGEQAAGTPALKPPEGEALLVEAVLAYPPLAREAAAERVEELFVSAELRRVLQRLEALVIEGVGEAGIAADDLIEALDDPATRSWVRGALLRATEMGAERAAGEYRRAREAVRGEAVRRRAAALEAEIRRAYAKGDQATAIQLVQQRRLAKRERQFRIVRKGHP